MATHEVNPLNRNPATHLRPPTDRRGVVAVVAMFFLVLMATLGLGMFAVAGSGSRSAHNLADAARAQAAAESGLRWQIYRFQVMRRPKTTVGNLTRPYVDAALWPALRSAVSTDWAGLPSPGVGPVAATAAGVSTGPVDFAPASADGGGPARFAVSVEKLPYYVADPLDDRYRHALRVVSVGTCGDARRVVSMAFRLDKRVRFAVVSKTRVQLGRNTLVDGPVAMGTRNKFSPFLILSDFTHVHPALASRVRGFEAWLDAHHDGYDGRVDLRSEAESTAAADAGYHDRDGDGFVDEFDLFLDQFDADGSGGVSAAEFADPATGQPYDRNLFEAIDSLGSPLFAGDLTRDGLNDGVLDGRDGYAKVRGGITAADPAKNWGDYLAGRGETIEGQLRGPVAPAGDSASAVTFGATSTDLIDLDPANFEACTTAYRARSGESAGPTVRNDNLVENATLAYRDWRGEVRDERTPFGSTSYQATYRRPVFRDMTFRNVTVPKSANALFVNCTFEGVTFVDMTRDIKKSNGQVTTSNGDAMTWSQRMTDGTKFNKDTPLSYDNSAGYNEGNNVRFDGCTFKGPLVSPYATAYSHFTNSWEFTGATKFDNTFDQSATIVAPQTNIEMGSFTNPGDAPSTLVGVVVAGNIDIRGTSVVDGSVIVTGDGAGNTTLGYFGPSDGDTDPGTLPEGGYGRLSLRYNPYRALPDGINLAVDIDPDTSTYREGE